MKATKILNEEIKGLTVSSLPSRPTAPTSFGGRGYTANQMKEAFDKLPLYIIEKFNALFDDITASGQDSLCGAIPTGIEEDHTLSELFSDITGGAFADYLSVDGESLTDFKSSTASKFSDTDGKINIIFGELNKKTIDCGKPADRAEV